MKIVLSKYEHRQMEATMKGAPALAQIRMYLAARGIPLTARHLEGKWNDDGTEFHITPIDSVRRG